MKKFIFLILFLPGIANAYSIQNGPDGNKLFAQGWRVICTPLSLPYYNDALKDVDKFKRVYTNKALSNLNKIIFCNKFYIKRGQHTATWLRGTYNFSDRTIFVKIDENKDADYLLHHEFSSILIKVYGASFEQKWRSINVEDYTGNYELDNNNSFVHLRDLHKKGWYRDYSKSSFENDFNIITGHYFTDWLNRKLMTSSLFYSKIKSKIDLMKHWYEKKGLLR